MAKTMTPSGMTAGQVRKFTDKLANALTKHRDDISKDAAQQVLGGVDNLGMEMFAVIRAHTERMSKFIVRIVKKVDRACSPKEALNTTGRRQYVTDSVVASMPRGEGAGAKVTFFKLDRYISDDDLEKEYELRGLKPADPYSLAAVNEADPAFADDHPNGTHWKDAEGKWCFATFYRWSDERSVNVHRDAYRWNDYWWFAGVCK